MVGHNAGMDEARDEGEGLQRLSLMPMAIAALMLSAACETPANDVGLEPVFESSPQSTPELGTTRPEAAPEADTAASPPEASEAEARSGVDVEPSGELASPSNRYDTTQPHDGSPADIDNLGSESPGPSESTDEATTDDSDTPDVEVNEDGDAPELGDAESAEDALGGSEGPPPLPSDCSGLAEDTPCDDGDLCTLNDACREETCQGESLDCSDQDPCTEDEACQQGVCIFTAIPDGKTCEGANGCTFAGTCKAGSCEPDEPLCPSEDPCKVGACVDETCIYESAANFTLCDDGNACTVYDRCISGSCFGSPMNCKDGEPCTSDSCDPDTGECQSELVEGCTPGTPMDFVAPDINPLSVSHELELSLASFSGKLLVMTFHSPS